MTGHGRLSLWHLFQRLFFLFGHLKTDFKNSKTTLLWSFFSVCISSNSLTVSITPDICKCLVHLLPTPVRAELPVKGLACDLIWPVKYRTCRVEALRMGMKFNTLWLTCCAAVAICWERRGGFCWSGAWWWVLHNSHCISQKPTLTVRNLPSFGVVTASCLLLYHLAFWLKQCILTSKTSRRAL